MLKVLNLIATSYNATDAEKFPSIYFVLNNSNEYIPSLAHKTVIFNKIEYIKQS